MDNKTQTKIQTIVSNWINGNKKDAAKMVNTLTKKQVFYISSSHMVLACRELLGNKELQVSLEDFIINSLEGAYL